MTMPLATFFIYKDTQNCTIMFLLKKWNEKSEFWWVKYVGKYVVRNPFEMALNVKSFQTKNFDFRLIFKLKEGHFKLYFYIWRQSISPWFFNKLGGKYIDWTKVNPHLDFLCLILSKWRKGRILYKVTLHLSNKQEKHDQRRSANASEC